MPTVPGRSGRRAYLDVVHIGVVGRAPGGMAQVVNSMMRWELPSGRMTAWASTRRARDPLAPFLFASVTIKLIAARLSGRRPIIACHLSERGSFIREGAIIYIASLLRTPAVAHLHGAQFIDFASAHPKLVTSVLRKAVHVAVLTPEVATTCRQLLGSDTKVSLVRNGVKVPTLPPTGKMRRILFGGEVGERKGADLLFDVWSRLAPEFPDWELHVAGPDRTDMANAYRQVPNLVCHGTVDHDVLMDMARRSMVAVLPSRNEALPVFLLETMARANAVIATTVGDVSSLVTPPCGLLVEPGSVGALEAAVREMLADEPRISRMGKASRARIEAEYSDRVARDSIMSLWEHCMNNFGG